MLRKLVALTLAVMLGAMPAAGQTVTPSQAQALVDFSIVANGVGAITAPVVHGVLTGIVQSIIYVQSLISPHAANNTVLSTLNAASTPVVFRDGYSSAATGGFAKYTGSTAPCSLNSGAGDGGSQVPSADNGCFLIDPNTLPLTPQIFGAVGDGSHDDAPAFIAEWAAGVRLNHPIYWGQAPRVWSLHSTFYADYRAALTVGSTGFHVETDGAVFDTTGAGDAVGFYLTCGGTPGQFDSSDCVGLNMQGHARFQGTAPNHFECVIGYPDERDVLQGPTIQWLFCANNSGAPTAGGAIMTHMTQGLINIIGDVGVGGGAGVANAEGFSAGRTFVSMTMTDVFGGSTGTYGDLVAYSVPLGATATPSTQGNEWHRGNDTEVGRTCFAVMLGTNFTANTLAPLSNCPHAYSIPASSLIFNNSINQPFTGNRPFNRGSAFGIARYGFGTQSVSMRPYESSATTYSVDGLDDTGIITSACAGALGPEVNLFQSTPTQAGSNQIVTTDPSASNIQAGYIATIIGMGDVAVSSVSVNNGTYTITIANNSPGVLIIDNNINFRPPSCPAAVGTQNMNVQLPHCAGTSAVNLNGRFSVSFMTANGYGFNLNPVSGEKIFFNNSSLNTQNIAGSSLQMEKLTCIGDGFWYASSAL